mmetsp:Transcript_27727/g.74069  ORF Transcript_27727/g.74069 Transcript_27727/m.74069 type:complete len:195 (+) Transcript_27727:99-683(+)
MGAVPSACLAHNERPRWRAAETRSPVLLNIYDIEVSCEVFVLNQALRQLGSGAFHCGVEVINREWSFQGTKPRITGVFCSPPKKCDGYRFVESIPMGMSRFSEQEIIQLIKTLEAEWPGRSYSPTHRNCTYFSQKFCECLGVCCHMPSWVMQLAGAGKEVLDTKDYYQEALRGAQCTLGCDDPISPRLRARVGA